MQCNYNENIILNVFLLSPLFAKGILETPVAERKTVNTNDNKFCSDT